VKFICRSVLLLWSIFVMSGNSFSQDQGPVLTGPYLGQTTPDLTPKIFAPGVVATRHREHSAFFSPDMQEFYFTRKDIDTKKWWLMRFKVENNRWHEAVVGPRIGRPILSPDGNTLHLGNKYRQRSKDGWSEVKSLGPMFEREDWGIMRLSASTKGTYVFDDYKNNDVIRISSIKNGKRQPARLMGPQINSGKWTAHPFIAADESYLIWDSEKAEGYGDIDLYISFRQADGSWGKAINLGNKINTDGAEHGAYVSPNGQFLFFNRNPIRKQGDTGSEGDIYWVDAQVIEKLRPG